MPPIAHERPVLARSLWTDTANPAPARPALTGQATADCVVIGGGFTGLSAALHLSEAGQKVVLLEAETPGWGASGRNGGQVNPGLKDGPTALTTRFGSDLGGRMARLSGDGGALVFDLIDRHGIACDAAQTGWVRAAHTSKALAKLQAVAAEWRSIGAPVDDLEARELAHLLGTPAYVGGIIDRRGGNLHPLNYALGLADAAERSGAVIHGDSRVTTIAPDIETVTVSTSGGEVVARSALICTNAYTSDLADPLGRSLVPVTSIQVATAPLSSNVAASILPQGHAISDTRRLLVYFRKDAQGRFVIGGRGALKDNDVRQRQVALRKAACKLFPQLEGVDWTHAWGGNVAITRDHLPGLHLVAPNIMAGLGYNGRGVAMATVMGTVLAKWASGADPAALDFPITRARSFPFHRFHQFGTGSTVAVYRMLDRLGV